MLFLMVDDYCLGTENFILQRCHKDILNSELLPPPIYFAKLFQTQGLMKQNEYSLFSDYSA